MKIAIQLVEQLKLFDLIPELVNKMQFKIQEEGMQANQLESTPP